MNSFSRNLDGIHPEFERLPTEAVALSQDQIDQAIKISNQAVGESQQWSIYLDALALFGFEKWLSENYPELMTNREYCSLFQLSQANILGAICHLKVGDFKLCLLKINGLGETIELPQLTLELPQFIAHFYVVTNVLEEDGYVQIWGFARYDQLVKQLQINSLQPGLDWCYLLPISWFDQDISKLLLHLSCLEPMAIVLPNKLTSPIPDFAKIQAELTQVLQQFPSPEIKLWEILTWEQGKMIFNHPELLDWLYQLQIQKIGDSSASQRQASLKRLSEPAINFALWIRNELDEVAKNLSWTLLPPLISGSFRGSYTDNLQSLETTSLSIQELPTRVDTLSILNTFLQEAGVLIPSEACIGYQDFDLAGNSLRLYAITWLLKQPSPDLDWTLLIILGARSGDSLPDAIQLLIRDEEQVLDQQVKTIDSTHLYSEVLGACDEKVWVTVTLKTGDTLTFPAFIYQSQC
ncbi:MAG: DUF1822 family protein [Microcoleaceae cyanobacterium]